MRSRESHRIEQIPPIRHPLFHLLILALIAGCASPQLQEPIGATGHQARLGAGVAIMGDGYRLPLRRWGDVAQPKAVLLAMHGFNDYSNAFADLGRFLAAQGILTYAFDQRGFGATTQRGRWAGEQRMISDLRMLSRLLRDRHPQVPFFLLGESMGGAVVIAATAKGISADGIVLVAPAVWSRDTMNPFQSILLEFAAHTVPWLGLTGSGLEIRPSDNLEMLRAFSADPLVIKRTRVDALWGVTNMMDLAMTEIARLPTPALLLYGEQDEIIPRRAFCAMLDRIPKDRRGVRMLLYRKGWHMLTRDLQGKRVLSDIATWLTDQGAPMPSGEEVGPGSRRQEQFCRGRSFRIASSVPAAR